MDMDAWRALLDGGTGGGVVTDAETAMALESVPGSDPQRRSAALETLHLRRLEAPILEAMASSPSAAPSRRAL